MKSRSKVNNMIFMGVTEQIGWLGVLMIPRSKVKGSLRMIQTIIIMSML